MDQRFSMTTSPLDPPPTVTISDWDIKVTSAYEANRHGLLAAAAQIVGAHHAADVAQDVFVRVWSNPASFDEARGSLTRYLYMVTRGTAIDRLRARTSAQARETNENNQAIAHVDDPSRRLVDVDRATRVRAAMATLRPAERDVIEAAFYDHLSYREVAVRLNLPEGTVKSRIRVGLVRLRRELLDADLLELA